MIGIEITHTDKKSIVGEDEGLIIIHIDSVNINNRKDTFIHSQSVNYDTNERKIWHEISPVSLGDVIEIKVTDTNNVDHPIKIVHENNIQSPISKLEEFYKIESLLKEKGLL